MHMADALLSPAVGLGFMALSGGALAYSARKLSEEDDERKTALMGVLGAFVFAAQMINFSIPGTGSSGHLVGGVLLIMLLGPYAAFITLSSVLIVQSLFFADGGILALGANVWNMAFYTAFAGWPLYRLFASQNPTRRRITVAALVIPVLTLELGALTVVLQTTLSGRSELPFDKFILLMAGIHLPIGLIEGMVTAAVINFVFQLRPEAVLSTLATSAKPVPRLSLRPVLIALFALTLLLGGVFAWFASSDPDGLEWSIAKIYGASELPAPETGIIARLSKLQEKTAFLPDYGFKSGAGPEEAAGEAKVEPGSPVSAGVSLSGVLGSMMVLGMVGLAGLVMLKLRGKGPQGEKT